MYRSAAVVHPRAAQVERYALCVPHAGSDDLGDEHRVVAARDRVGDPRLEPVRPAGRGGTYLSVAKDGGDAAVFAQVFVCDEGNLAPMVENDLDGVVDDVVHNVGGLGVVGLP